MAFWWLFGLNSRLLWYDPLPQTPFLTIGLILLNHTVLLDSILYACTSYGKPHEFRSGTPARRVFEVSDDVCWGCAMYNHDNGVVPFGFLGWGLASGQEQSLHLVGVFV